MGRGFTGAGNGDRNKRNFIIMPFRNNSPVNLHCSPATTILNENPAREEGA